MELQGATDRLEIRCCCNPDRLYGTLRVHGIGDRGERVRLTLPFVRDDVGTVTGGGEVLLSVDLLGTLDEETGRIEYRPALKYEGDDEPFERKLARLRHVPGFEPSAEARAILGIPTP